MKSARHIACLATDSVGVTINPQHAAQPGIQVPETVDIECYVGTRAMPGTPGGHCFTLHSWRWKTCETIARAKIATGIVATSSS